MSRPSARSYNRGLGLSVAVLAGGKSIRMQTDKAFLKHNGRPFISLIVEEASRVSTDVIVVVGKKDRSKFESVLPANVRVVNDNCDFGSPLGGMLTAFGVIGRGYAAMLACDTPLIRASALRFMHEAAISHSAAIPLWESGRVEPLFSVYNVGEAAGAALRSADSDAMSCRSMIALLRDVNYVPVSRLRELDPSLSSLLNFNTPADLKALDLNRETSVEGTIPLQSGEVV